MNVTDILKDKGLEVISVNTDEKVCDAMKLMNAKKIGSVIVKSPDGSIAGIMSERDVLRCHQDKLDVTEKRAGEIMTPADKLIVASADDNIQYVMAMMTEHRIKHMPVMKKNQLIGLISIGDVIKALLDQSQQQTKRLQDYIAGTYPEE